MKAGQMISNAGARESACIVIYYGNNQPFYKIIIIFALLLLSLQQCQYFVNTMFL